MAVSPNTTFVSGAILTAAQQNNFPRGVMAYSVYTGGNQGLTTTLTDVNGATGTFTAVANRAYKVTFQVYGAKNVSAGAVSLELTNGAGTTTYGSTGIYSANTGVGINFSMTGLVTTLTAGTQTLKMRAQTDVTTAAFFMSAGLPGVFIIEDIGGI
jgi:hypothetical protein